MLIALYSDMHSEFYHPDEHEEYLLKQMDRSDVDVVILAGDILVARNTHKFLQAVAGKFKHVIYVAGNHEYYCGEFNAVQRHLHSTGLDNVHYLENEAVEIDGQRFVGCTLWYHGGPSCVANEWGMNDFRKIYNEKQPFRQFIYKYAKDSRAWLEDNVQEGDVVVTHMLPSIQCIDNGYRHHSMNEFYYHECEHIMEKNKPKLWCHGHSHNHYDKMIHNTRVVRNPFGYPGEAGVNHIPNFRIEI